MDALSDVLKSVRLEGAVYLDAEFTAPWSILGGLVDSVKKRLRSADHVMYFHFLTDGGCKVRLFDTPQVLDVGAGDLVLFAQDDAHIMGSDVNLAPADTDAVFRDGGTVEGDLIHLRYGGGGAPTRFVCGYLACNRSVCRPLLECLPRLLRIRVVDPQSSALVRDLLRLGVRESSASRPGAASLLTKVAELVFVEAMRRHAETLPPDGRGWLAGVRDPQIGRVLALLHGDPARAWTIETLAAEVALSRSALAERFADVVGEPPIQYLTRWRLALAAQALRAGEAIVRVAERAGYESQAAFSRAFKREFGMPPGAWRNAPRGA